MILSLSWLREYVDAPMDSAQLAHALTMAGIEVETVSDRYDHLDSVVVGRVESMEDHPNAERLKVLNVLAGDRTFRVVCGAPNVRPGCHAALALPGTRLADGSMVQAGRVRDIESEAVLCSEAELSLGPDASGLLLVSEPRVLGMKIREALNLSDPVFHLSVTPNRPDCLSVFGIAREVAAIAGVPLKRPKLEMDEDGPEISTLTRVDIEAPDLCPRYTARVLLGIEVGPSPFWLSDRLMAVGQRPINNIVDVTNYVMLETGQPLHAFDYDTLAEGRIVVRAALDQEPFTTLDGQEKILTQGMLLICDGKKPVALAGVMGGANSEIRKSTRNILIESAHFSPVSIRKTSKKLGYHTEASHRFERTTDILGTPFAADRAAMLMKKAAGGKLAKGAADVFPRPALDREILVSTRRTNHILGTNVSQSQIMELLGSVEIKAKAKDPDAILTVPPSFRPDITRPEDLAEEVARLWGFDRIPTTNPLVPMEAPPADRFLEFQAALRGLLTGLGFMEAITYSFVASDAAKRLGIPPDDERSGAVVLRNPLNENQTVMRTSLAPGMLETVARNLNQQNRDLALFEMGKVFIPKPGDPLPREQETLAMLLCGALKQKGWLEKGTPADFFDLKGAFEALLSKLTIGNATFVALKPEACDFFRPGRSASIHWSQQIVTAKEPMPFRLHDDNFKLYHNDLRVWPEELRSGQTLGRLGEMRPEAAARFDVKEPVFFLEADVEALAALVPASIKCRPLPRFPATDRDLTLILGRDVPAQAVLNQVLEMNHETLESIRVLDNYEGAPVPAGKRSLSFRATYRSKNATLTDEFVNGLHKTIGEELIRTFNAGSPASQK